MFSNGYLILWAIALVGFVVVELATVQLVSIWFVIGAVPALIAAALGGEFWVQLAVFLATSVLALLLIRPMLAKKTYPQATNADRVIGATGLVLEDINNLQQTGRVSANGLTWTARTPESDLMIPKNAQVKVLHIEGVKLIVVPK